MATLQELIPYLSRGFTIQSARGETIRPLSGSRVAWHKSAGYRFASDPEIYTMAQMSTMSDMWSWSVLFLSPAGKPYGLTSIAEIEQAIKNNIPGAAYGAQPE